MIPSEVAPRLLPWFDAHGRQLPWRGCGDPYRVWVSEVMLQQTRVDVVIPYYERFLARFPTLSDLAAADVEEVLAAWSGLGFYRRARNLHAGARQIEAVHGGQVPRDPVALGSIKGIGRYTVGAILSACWDDRLPILDGNVIRVLSRLARILEPPDRAASLARLWQLAEQVLPDARAGDFNQALMDLGATVCKPQSPRCAACPLDALCLAREEGDAEDLPRPGRRQRVRFDARIALRLELPDGRILLQRRPEGGLLGGMWELPSAELGAGDLASRAARDLHELLQPGARSDPPVALGAVEHRFSHRHWSVAVYGAPVSDPLIPGARRRRWVGADELDDLALPTVTRRTLDLLFPAP